MANTRFELTELAVELRSRADHASLEEIDLLKDVHCGLADVEARRVVPHEEARARLLSRYHE